MQRAPVFDAIPPDSSTGSCRYRSRRGRNRQRGHIVNIASGAGKVGVPFAVAYATSKHGLVGFTNSLRCEYLKSPVGFSVVCPGFVTETGMYARWEDQGTKAPKLVGRSTPNKVAQVVVRCIQKNRGEVLVNTGHRAHRSGSGPRQLIAVAEYQSR